jgi:hypothetical protein
MGHLKSYQSHQSLEKATMAPTSYPGLLVQRCGNVLTITSEDNMPLDLDFVNLLVTDLKYQHVEHLQGQAQRNPITGQRQFFKTTEYKLFRYENGKLVLLGGYLARIAARLKKLGVRAKFQDVSPPRKRPNCFSPKWDNLTGRISFRPRQEECLKTISTVPCGVIKAVTGFG